MGYNTGMQWVKELCLFGLSFGIVFCAACFASAESVSFASNPIWLSDASVTEGTPVQVSTVITKQSDEAISGTVTFYAGEAVIGISDFSLTKNVGGVVVAVSWVPSRGTHGISAKITRAVVSRAGTEESLPISGEVKAKETLIVAPDNDRDAIADANDTDDDNDGIADADETRNGTDPLTKEAAPAPQVAGAATSSGALGKATDIAKNTGALIFAETEELRNSAADYFDAKLAETEAARKAKQEAAKPNDGADLGKLLVAEPKSLTDQVKDTSGLLEGIKMQAYKMLSFIFGNIYAFYIVLIFIVLWILRKIWKRFSLD